MDIIVYELWKINESGTVFEGVWKTGTIPSHIDPSLKSYTVYYRDTDSAHAVAENKLGKMKI
jgi:hypothetical protein